MNLAPYLESSDILDFNSNKIHNFIKEQIPNNLSFDRKIQEIYDFVKNKILFGFNKRDNIPASKVLKDGYGQCNTKTTLFIALCRAVGIPCRSHFFQIRKEIMKGVFPKHIYNNHIPREIIHSWPEVFYKEKWIPLEGIILDSLYLEQIKIKFEGQKKFTGYGISVKNLNYASTDWTGGETFIQKESISQDEGIYIFPDKYYKVKEKNISGIKNFVFNHIIRKIANKRIKRIREGKWDKWESNQREKET